MKRSSQEGLAEMSWHDYSKSNHWSFVTFYRNTQHLRSKKKKKKVVNGGYPGFGSSRHKL